MPVTTRQWLLNNHPNGRPLVDDDFKLSQADLPAPGAGEMLFKTLYLGFDPAQKGWMENVADYVAPMAIGDVMRGSFIGQVVESNGGKFSVGDVVAGTGVWQDYQVSNGAGLEKVYADLPPTAMLSVLGVTGITAYCGLFKLGKPVAGDTVVVSGAAGATGSVVCQLAKAAGCRVIGIAGGADKCQWLKDVVGCDGVVDYKSEPVRKRLKELCPHGINVIFDNVGGTILNDMLALIATAARIVICGGISRYQTGTMPAGPENYFNLVFRRASMHGFIVLDWLSEFPDIRRRLGELVHQGKLRYQEDVQSGFENAPRTLMRLFDGSNRGKQLLKVADPG
jgi:NADPH-dependent curcumin reductase CurA